jgi:hypothetical protein
MMPRCFNLARGKFQKPPKLLAQAGLIGRGGPAVIVADGGLDEAGPLGINTAEPATAKTLGYRHVARLKTVKNAAEVEDAIGRVLKVSCDEVSS